MKRDEEVEGVAFKIDDDENIKVKTEQNNIWEPLNAVFAEESVNKLFSPQWQSKEVGLNECETEMQNLKVEKGQVTFKAGCIATGRALQDKIFQVVTKGMSLLETTLTSHKDTQMEGAYQLLHKYVLKDLYQRLGDNNVRLRERAEDLFLVIAT